MRAVSSDNVFARSSSPRFLIKPRIAQSSVWLAAVCSAVSHSARSQTFDQYLSPDIPGFEAERGPLIAQRPRSEYDPLGVHVGDFTIRPQVDESTGYQTNVTGTRGSPGSWVVGTAPQVNFASGFGRNSLAGGFGLNNQEYLDQKQQTHTDWNAALGGSYQIGNDVLTVAISESYVHQLQTSLDSAILDKPLGFKATDFRIQYETPSTGRLRLEPTFEYTGFRFDPVTLPGAIVSQKANDRDEYAAGLIARYGASPTRNLVAEVKVIDTLYIAALGGAPRPNTIAYEGLVGIDYAFSGNLQALLLVGYEYREFTGGVYPKDSSPVGQATIIWTPTGLTTITGKATRSILDTVGTTTTGVTLTQGGIVIDHELKRNWLLQGRSSVLFADYGLAAGTQTLYALGASATYLFNRNVRVIGSYDFTSLNGATSNTNGINLISVLNTTGSILPQNNLASTSGNFNAHTVTVTLRFAL